MAPRRPLPTGKAFSHLSAGRAAQMTVVGSTGRSAAGTAPAEAMAPPAIVRAARPAAKALTVASPAGAGYVRVIPADEPLLDLERPVDVADVVGRVLAPSGSQEIDQGPVLADRDLFPFLDEPLQPREIVEPLFQVIDDLDQAVVAAKRQEDVVKGQVLVVIGVEIAGPDRLGHALVQGVHALDVGRFQPLGSLEQGHALQGADDLVVVPDVLLGQGVDD